MGILDTLKWKFKSQKEKDAIGEKWGKYVINKAQEFADARFSQITLNLLSVLSDRLETVYDDKEIDPKITASIEMKIFIENIEGIHEKLLSELQNHLKADFESFDDQEFNNLLIEVVINPKVDQLIQGAKELYQQKLNEIETNKKT